MEINDKYLIDDIKNDLKAIKKALEGKQLSGTSLVIDEYEDKLAKFFGSKKALAISSGSAALHASLYTLGVKQGDEVLISALATLPTAMPIITAGAIPVVVDIEKNGIGFDKDDLKKKISKKTKAAIQLPLWGYPIDYSRTQKLLTDENIPMIEDDAQAHGAMFNGKYLGTFGTIGCFSTHDRKILPTGEGGYMLIQDEKLYDKAKQFIQLGFMDGKTYGVNYKLSSLQAAIGISRIGQIESQITKRLKVVNKFLKSIEDLNIKPLNIEKEGRSNYYSLVLTLPWDKKTNRNFIEEVSKRGIPSDITKYKYCAIYERELFSKYKSKCKNAEDFITRMTTVPIRPNFSQEEIQYITNIYRETYDKFNR